MHSLTRICTNDVAETLAAICLKCVQIGQAGHALRPTGEVLDGRTDARRTAVTLATLGRFRNRRQQSEVMGVGRWQLEAPPALLQSLRDDTNSWQIYLRQPDCYPSK